MFGYQTHYKRIFDVCLALMLAITMLPFVVIIATLILIVDGKPVIFKQLRLGKDNKRFMLYKFRTLHLKEYVNFEFTSEDVTTIGQFLRAFGLDEIPQIVNVLKGEMSWVGPRPLPVEYLTFLKQHVRSQTTPGITGLVQIKGGNRLSWKQRFMLDKVYVSDICFKKDIEILLKTVFILFKSRRDGSTTLTESF